MAKRAIAGAVILLLGGCSDPVEGECLDDPTIPECVRSCEEDPTRAWCRSDGGPADMADLGGEDGFVDPCGSCGAGTVCDAASGTCVACLGDEDCDGATPVCLVNDANATDNACVGCIDTEDCDTGICDTESNACVACLADADCTDPATAKCDTGTNTCVGCDSSTQCEGTGQNECAAGACVECTEATAETHCGDLSCNPATNECTETEVDTVPDCGRCVSDTECMDPDARCVPMNYMGTPRPDGYCLRLVSAGCERPYGSTLITAESLSGAGEADYCGIEQELTTCDAVRAMREGRECTGGDVTLCADAGARCETIGAFDDLCTYSCGTATQCPVGVSCGSAYCGS